MLSSSGLSSFDADLERFILFKWLLNGVLWIVAEKFMGDEEFSGDVWPRRMLDLDSLLLLFICSGFDNVDGK